MSFRSPICHSPTNRILFLLSTRCCYQKAAKICCKIRYGCFDVGGNTYQSGREEKDVKEKKRKLCNDQCSPASETTLHHETSGTKYTNRPSSQDTVSRQFTYTITHAFRWLSSRFYWHETLDKDPDLDKLQRRAASGHAKLFCCLRGKPGCELASTHTYRHATQSHFCACTNSCLLHQKMK